MSLFTFCINSTSTFLSIIDSKSVESLFNIRTQEMLSSFNFEGLMCVQKLQNLKFRRFKLVLSKKFYTLQRAQRPWKS